jgi:hypothetical protein
VAPNGSQNHYHDTVCIRSEVIDQHEPVHIGRRSAWSCDNNHVLTRQLGTRRYRDERQQGRTCDGEVRLGVEARPEWREPPPRLVVVLHPPRLAPAAHVEDAQRVVEAGRHRRPARRAEVARRDALTVLPGAQAVSSALQLPHVPQPHRRVDRTCTVGVAS